MKGAAADVAIESSCDLAMKILVLNAGSSSQKSCLYEFKVEALAAPSRPLWEAEIDWTHHQGSAELKVATADGVSLQETLKSESRSEATGHMLRTLWSRKTKIIAQPSDIDVVGHRVVHGGLEFEQSTFVTPEVKAAIAAWELFDEQSQQYQDSVLPPSVTARVTVEEASPIGWERYAGRHGAVLGMRTFGMSAPMKVVAEHFGFTPDHVAAVAKEVLARCRERTTLNG